MSCMTGTSLCASVPGRKCKPINSSWAIRSWLTCLMRNISSSEFDVYCFVSHDTKKTFLISSEIDSNMSGVMNSNISF